MSAEAILLSKLIEEGAGALRQVYTHGIGANHFTYYRNEFTWVESRVARRKPINRRIFRETFPDFEWSPTIDESTPDLALELKEEVALAELTALIATLSEEATKDNVLSLALQAREVLTTITRSHSLASDVDLDDWEHTIQEMRQGQILAAQGKRFGLLTGFPHIDTHWGGINPGQFIEILGRTGQGKSYFLMLLAWLLRRKNGARIGIFSPELSEHEVKSRYHTIASADKEIQAALGLSRSFRNRALMDRNGFNLKSYQALNEHLATLDGCLRLFCSTGMSERMSVAYIEDRVIEHSLDAVIVDPIYLLAPVRLHAQGNEHTELSWVAHALHDVTERLNVPVIFSNQSHLAGDDAPTMGQSFGAKGLVHLSDYVLGVMHFSRENRMVCTASKARFGAGFRFEMQLVCNTGYWKVDTPIIGNFYNSVRDEGDDEDLKKIAYSANANGNGNGAEPKGSKRKREMT